ncbi:hypothetical protein [Pararhizobium sp. A13]
MPEVLVFALQLLGWLVVTLSLLGMTLVPLMKFAEVLWKQRQDRR